MKVPSFLRHRFSVLPEPIWEFPHNVILGINQSKLAKMEK